MTIHSNTHQETYSKTHGKPRSPRTAIVALAALAVIALGSLVLLAFSCAPATPAVDGRGTTDPVATAAGAPTGLAIDSTSTDSSSFVVQWTAPTETGTGSDGTALDPKDIGYRIYYLAGTTDQTTGQTTPSTESVTAESLRQNADTQTQEVIGVANTRIIGLTPDTRYFVTIASFNTLAPLLAETVSSEVVATTTNAGTQDFDGSLSYAETTYEFGVGLGGTITPDSTPAIPGGSSTSTSTSYALEIIDGTVFDPELGINDSGIITIDSTTSTGTARYFVRAEATNYNTQRVMLTITVNKADFEGSLSYAETTYEFGVGLGGTITPDGTPAIPGGSSTSTSISYVLEIIDGTALVPDLAIDDRGVITIDSTTSAGTAQYLIRAEATDYNTQTETLSITVIETGRLQVRTYYSDVATDMLPVELGQAVADDSTRSFSLADTDVILTLSNLTDGDYTIYFGTVASGEANTHDGGSFRKIATNSTITILKSELAANSFSFTDGAVIGISGSGITGTEQIATYLPSNIYNHQDLQAMRKDLGRSYSLKKNIEFSSVGTGNYEAVGNESNPFTGNLDGAGNSITGVEIESTNDYQGLFGVMEASSVDTRVAQDLVLNDFKIVGNTHVGSLAGLIRRGTIDSVRVEVSAPDAGKVTATGETIIDTNNRSYGGGLLGYAGMDATDTEVRIRNTSSAVAVVGLGTASNVIGGLVGYTNSSVILTESYATGSVTSTGSYAGGLVGWNKGNVTGYAMGDVTGTDFVGGLIGWNEGTMTGYTTGNVIGTNFSGGLVGLNSDGIVTGYARGAVRRRDGNVSVSFGRTIGLSTEMSTTKTYNSLFENKIYIGETGTSALTGAIGVDGVGVNIYSASQQTSFSDLDFGTELGEWTWVEDDKWPAINIGEVKPANEQPIDACVFAEFVDQCQAISTLQIGPSLDNLDGVPVEFGQAIADNGMFSLANETVIVTISGLVDRGYTIRFGSVGSGGTNDYSGRSYQKTAVGGVIQVLKSDLATNSFSFIDGAVIGISGGFAETQHVATYRPSNIYIRQDLQGMRQNLALDYVLKRDITFSPPTGTDTSNYEAVGDGVNPFTGSLDGAGYRITGVEIESTGNDQGLFGVIEAGAVDAVVVQNLVLNDFKIKANASVGSLVGWIKQGTVDDVRVVISQARTGRIEASGSITVEGYEYGYGGGLVGRAGITAGTTQVRIQNTSSAVSVFGTGAESNQIGGLVGEARKNVTVTKSSTTGSVTGVDSAGGLVGWTAGTVSGSATGIVKGVDYVGGLVGGNVEGTVSGFATGIVRGADYAGGLAGWSNGTVVGYATGTVSGNNAVGGLVGNNANATTGYATGSVTGAGSNVGGLVGQNIGALSGYATGEVTGVGPNVGGLVGDNNGGAVRGYARGRVIRSEGTNLTFGKTIGRNRGMLTSYSSVSKSQIFDGFGTTLLTGTTGVDGTAVTIFTSTQGTFSRFSYGNTVNEWVWEADGKWPAINIGTIKPAAEQPINP